MANILVIDDDELILKTVSAALRKAGHLVVTAKDGYEALETAERELFEFIISDANMPGGFSGFNVISTLRKIEKYQSIPIMLLTGRRDKKDVMRAIEAGADDYIVKPVDYDMLLAKVESLLTTKPKQFSFSETDVHREASWNLSLHIVSISEQGISLRSEIPLPINFKLCFESPIFVEIGIVPPQLRIAACDAAADGHTCPFYWIKWI